MPETWAYRISGSAKLSPQHCQVQFFIWNEHLQEVSEELVTRLHDLPVKKCVLVFSDINNKLSIGAQSKDKQQLTSLNHKWILSPSDLQRVPSVITPEERVDQRVDTTTHPPFVPALQRLTDAPPIMVASNPTTRCVLKLTRRTHSRHTQNNTPGSIPAVTQAPSARQQVLTSLTAAPIPPTPRCSPHPTTPSTATRIPRVQVQQIQGGINHTPLISQEAINFLTECFGATLPDIFMPAELRPKTTPPCLNFKQITMPMVHPTTGKTIGSYKRLVHNPAMAETWQTAFDKDFGSMAQGDNKTGL